MEELGMSQRVQLELADLLHKICGEEKIPYTLLAGSIAAWQEYGGFAPYMENIAIGMLYPSWLRFIETCKKRLCKTDYYILDSQNCEQFEELFVRLCKRSGVKLPEERKKDEVYYDYFINIYPICYVGNTEKEFQKIKKQYTLFRRCKQTKKVSIRNLHIKNSMKLLKSSFYYFQRNQYSFEQIKELITRYGEKESKYVFIPTMNVNQGISYLAETYQQLKEVTFQGHTYSILVDTENWIDGYYNKKTYEALQSKTMNKASVVGPEIMRRIQLIELEMLKEFDRICRKNGLKYVLYSGTLLGAVRHSGFIPWDDDIDVAMLYEDYEKFVKIAPKELDLEKFFLRTQETDKDCNLTFIQIKRNGTIYCREMRNTFDTHLGVFMDIFPLFNGSNLKIIHKIQHKICKFYKSVVWSHMGAIAARKKKTYYMLLSKISNKTAYKRFMRWATLIKKPTGKLAYLSFKRNPYNVVHTRRETYENLKEISFEGSRFYVPANYEEVLSSIYSEEYLKYPPMSGRRAKHMPAIIDIGDLYKDLRTP